MRCNKKLSIRINNHKPHCLLHNNNSTLPTSVNLFLNLLPIMSMSSLQSISWVRSISSHPIFLPKKYRRTAWIIHLKWIKMSSASIPTFSLSSRIWANFKKPELWRKVILAWKSLVWSLNLLSAIRRLREYTLKKITCWICPTSSLFMLSSKTKTLRAKMLLLIIRFKSFVST